MSLEPQTNPFQLKPIQNPVEFIGRQKELKNAVDSMASFKHILLQGEKGIGKTSFLNYLTCSDATAWIGLPENHLCVYFNLQYFIGERLEHILQTLSKTIARKIHTSTFPDYAEEFHQLAESINEKFDADSWCREFQQLSSLLPCKLHVLFDDFAQMDGVEEEFYGAIQKISHIENISYVIASSTESAFFQMNIPTKIPLGPFQEKEVYQLIFDYFIRADVEPSLSEKLWEHAPFLHETTGYHPFFLQNYCYHLYTRIGSAGWPEGKAQKEALRDFKRFAIPRFQEYWKTSSQEEQDLMKKLATSQVVGNDNYRIQPVIRKLQDRSLIIQSRKSTQIGSEWSLFSSLFRDWIIKNEIQKLECPYRGLAAFQEQDARFFFGRERFVDRLVDVVVPSSVVSIIGSSGSGKSSVVFAGLIPRLRAQGNWVITLIFSWSSSSC